MSLNHTRDVAYLFSKRMERLLIIHLAEGLSLREKDGKDAYSIYLGACRLSSKESYSHLLSYLHHDENSSLKTFISEKRIRSYLLGRIAAKSAVSSMTGMYDWEKIGIQNGVFKQPVLIGPIFSSIQVSITHCNEFGIAVAFPAGVILGIDLEWIIRDSLPLVVLESCTEHEKQLILGFAEDKYPLASCMIWTLKESLSKALKTGFTQSLDILEVQKIEPLKVGFRSIYTYFPQFQSLTFSIQDYLCSMTYPKHLIIDTDFSRIRNHLEMLLITRGG
ncbi:4'-phosphopantetheinyl transferase family protein [Paenibacillus sp. NPDC055715]